MIASVAILAQAILAQAAGRLRPRMGWAASSQGTGERTRPETGEASWHRRARRGRQQDRILLAVSKASERLANHHSMSHGASPKGGRPWVCCTQCVAKSWVFTDLGIRNCKFCRSPFPVGPKGSDYEGGEPTPRAGGKNDLEAALQLLLKSDKCVSYKDALLGMSREVCPPQPKTPGAIITAASHRVCRAVKERDAAKAKLDRVPAIMQSMVEELQKLRDSVPSLRADLEAAETELAVASVENDKVLRQAHVPAVQIQIPEGMGDEAKAFVYDSKARIEPLSKQLAVLCSPGTSSSSFQQQQRHGGKQDKQQQHEGKHDKQQQQQQHDEHRHKQGGEESAGEVAGNRWRAGVPPNVDPGVSGGDLSDLGHDASR